MSSVGTGMPMTNQLYNNSRNWDGSSFTYKDDDEIKYCPKAAKILCKSERDPLEEHLNDKDQAESKVGPIQYPFQWFIRVEMDILEAQRDT